MGEREREKGRETDEESIFIDRECLSFQSASPFNAHALSLPKLRPPRPRHHSQEIREIQKEGGGEVAAEAMEVKDEREKKNRWSTTTTTTTTTRSVSEQKKTLSRPHQRSKKQKHLAKKKKKKKKKKKRTTSSSGTSRSAARATPTSRAASTSAGSPSPRTTRWRRPRSRC